MDVYTIAGFVSSALLILLGLYILKADPRYSTNRMAAIFAFLGMAWCLGKSMEDLSLNENIAFLWGRFAEAGLILLLPVFVHFACIFPRPRPLRTHVTLIYLPATVFMGLLFAELFTGEYILLVSPTRIPYSMYQLIFVCFAMFNLARAYVKSRYAMERIQLKLTLIGVGISLSIAAFTLSLNIFFAGNMGRPAVFVIPVSIGFIIYAITRYNMFILPPMPKFLLPMPEAELKTKLKYKLKEGSSYLIKEEEFERGPKIFRDLTTHDIPGIWLTTSYPNEIREKYGLARTPILYLKSKSVSGEVVVPPDRLDKAIGIISNYFVKPYRSVVFVDCFKKLVVINGFEKALDFLRKLGKMCSQKNSNLIVQIDPSKFEKKQLAAIEKVVARVASPTARGPRIEPSQRLNDG